MFCAKNVEKKIKCGESKNLEIVCQPFVPQLTLPQITLTKRRFVFLGEVLNLYDTYDSDKNFKKFLRTDLADETGVGTITLSFGPKVINITFPKLLLGLA